MELANLKLFACVLALVLASVLADECAYLTGITSQDFREKPVVQLYCPTRSPAATSLQLQYGRAGDARAVYFGNSTSGLIWLIGGSDPDPIAIHFINIHSTPITADVIPTRLNCPRGGHFSAVLLDDSVLICGDMCSGMCEVFKPHGRFLLKNGTVAPMPDNLEYSTGVALKKDGRPVMVIIGAKDFTTRGATFVYDLAMNEWSIKAPIPKSGLIDGAAVALDDSTLMYCGGFDGHADSECYVYNLDSDTWTVSASLNTPRSNLALLKINGAIFAIGGNHNGTILSSVESYNPTTQKFETLDDGLQMPATLIAGAVVELPK